MLSLKDRVHAHWSDVRRVGRGLRLAWVSVTSVAFGAILFYSAPQAQDLFLEVRGSLLSGTLFWTEFYLLTLFAWALPVYVSSRWILSRFDRQALLFGAEQLPVDDWVRQWIPPPASRIMFRRRSYRSDIVPTRRAARSYARGQLFWPQFIR